jgi:iron complex transport system ATP-binding protein
VTMPCERGALTARGVSFAYGGEPVVSSVTLAVAEGELVALAGPNGSGKTTLLRLMSGLRRPRTGFVTLDGRMLHQLSPRERARAIAVVPQRIEPRLMFSARQLVAMGRTPYSGLFGQVSREDRCAVEEALRATDMLDLADRRFGELSGGEQQRVALAMALAQEARYLLLDEPTVHLDLQHQHELLELLRGLHIERGVGILTVMHDLNLATLYFDRLALLADGHLVAEGPCGDLVRRPEVLAQFHAPLAVVDHPSAGVPQVLLEKSS